jgi:hypothetical protein
MEATLRKEAEEKIALNQQRLKELDANIDKYNRAVSGINLCLQALGLNREMLPLILLPDSSATVESTEISESSSERNTDQVSAPASTASSAESFAELDSFLDDLT